MAERRVMYMHTLCGYPATFNVLWQIIHRVPDSSRHFAKLVGSMEEVRRHRKLSHQALKREGKPTVRYGVARVEVPRG